MVALNKFDTAVEYAKFQFSQKLSDPNFNILFSDERLASMGMIGFYPSSLQTKALDSLIAESSKDRLYEKMLKLAIARAIGEGIELPPVAKFWLQKFLTGELSAPPGNRGRPQKTTMDILIFHTVQDLVDYQGLNATRNETSNATSASDAVAEALRQLGELPNSYDRVRKIWQNKPGLRVYVEE